MGSSLGVTRHTAHEHFGASARRLAAEVRDAIEHLGGLVGLLQVSDAKLRSRFYEEAGVLGTYLPDSRSVDIEADPCVRKVRVGGGT